MTAVYNFKQIDEFPGYSVSDCGCVYSDVSGKTLKARRVNGYSMVALGGRGGRQIGVHVLVASAFLGARPDGMVVNHKNGNRTDNRVRNLEWVTQSENVRHAYLAGLRVIDRPHRQRAALLGKAKRSFTDEQADAIRSAYTGARGQIVALSKEYGLSRYAVANIVGGTQ